MENKQVIIGFTGSRLGMHDKQISQFVEEFNQLMVCEFHHGDCLGADEISHDIVFEFFPNATIHIHPPTNSIKRAYCKGGILHPEKPYMARNQDIIDACDILIAAPSGPEELRSGTWSTVRKARIAQKKIIILQW